MVQLGDLAKKYDIPIQSHISENIDEIKFVSELFPESKNYADVYHKYNLLTEKCIMAHCVHLSDAEVELFKNKKTSVSHCPNSNTNLQSGMCDVKRLIESGVNVGLGSDISGGNQISILDCMRSALNVSHSLNFMKKQHVCGTGWVEQNLEVNSKYTPLHYKQGIYLATLGGATALNLDNKIGNFAFGKDFDALLIDIDRHPIDSFDLPATLTSKLTDLDKFDQMLQRFVYVGDDRNILEVYVKGKQIKN